MTHTTQYPRLLALVLAASLALPAVALTAGCGSKGGGTSDTAPSTASPGASTSSGPAAGAPAAKPGLSTGQKAVIVLAGAALLYYLYKKHQASQQAQGTAGAGGQQLYRSKNGGIYYRDPQTHKAIWVTAPAQGVSVPADQVQQYAPDYQQYQNQPAPPAPAGYQTQSATEFDPSLAGAGQGQ